MKKLVIAILLVLAVFTFVREYSRTDTAFTNEIQQASVKAAD